MPFEGWQPEDTGEGADGGLEDTTELVDTPSTDPDTADEGPSLDTLRQMVVMGMGIAFLPALYVRSEIHRPRELRVTSVRGEEIQRTHSFAWRKSSPAHRLFHAIADEVRTVAARSFVKEVKPVSRRRSPARATPQRADV